MWFPLCEYDYAVWQTEEGRMRGQAQTNMEEVKHNEKRNWSLVPPNRTLKLTATRFEEFGQETNRKKCHEESALHHQRGSVCTHQYPRAGKQGLWQDVLSGFQGFWHALEVHGFLSRLKSSLMDSKPELPDMEKWRLRQHGNHSINFTGLLVKILPLERVWLLIDNASNYKRWFSVHCEPSLNYVDREFELGQWTQEIRHPKDEWEYLQSEWRCSYWQQHLSLWCLCLMIIQQNCTWMCCDVMNHCHGL